MTRPYNNQQKKRICEIVDLDVLIDHGVKLKESEKKDKYLDFTRELKKTVEQESEVCTNYNWCSWYSHQRNYKGSGGFGRVEIIKTIGLLRSARILRRVLGDLRRLAVIQTPVEDDQLTLM